MDPGTQKELQPGFRTAGHVNLGSGTLQALSVAECMKRGPVWHSLRVVA